MVAGPRAVVLGRSAAPTVLLIKATRGWPAGAANEGHQRCDSDGSKNHREARRLQGC